MQHDMIIDNNTGRNVRLDINDALGSLVSNSSGDTEPTVTYPFMFWVDTSGVDAVLKIRNETDDGWIDFGIITPSLGALLKSGGTMTGALLASNLTTAATPDLAFSGDSDTGIFSSGANLLGLVAAGVELLRADGVLGYIKLLGTKALQLPSGSVAQRPGTGVNGMLRYNSDSKVFEGYANSTWGSLGGFSGYGAVVGSASYCTHADLSTALADVTVVAGSRILVTANETVNSTISVAKANIQLEFLPGITFTNGTAGTGITVDAGGCRIKGARLSGFTSAISISATFQYNFITECRFASCTAEVTEVDAAPVNVIANNISE